MSKSAFRQLSFQEKRANFSTRIQANGRISVLPKEAIEQEIVKTELRSTLEELFRQRAVLTAQRNTYPQHSPEWLRIDQTLNRVRGNLGHTQKMLSEAKAVHHAVLFEFVATIFLSEQALSVIRQAVGELKGEAPKANNA